MHLEVRHLRLMAAITDAGGVTGGAERVGLSQSALSHQLAEIESRLGTRLFTRTGRQMLLTPAGRRLLESARGILAELERVELELMALGSGGPPGQLRLATECYTCYHWLPAVMSAFRQRFARVEISLVPEATRRPLDALKVDELDLAIVSESLARPRKDLPRRFTGSGERVWRRSWRSSRACWEATGPVSRGNST